MFNIDDLKNFNLFAVFLGIKANDFLEFALNAV
jgi:hypothetical protein